MFSNKLIIQNASKAIKMAEEALISAEEPDQKLITPTSRSGCVNKAQVEFVHWLILSLDIKTMATC